MSEEIKVVEMYSYIVDGKELWTSNLIFAEIRARLNNSKVYVETITVEE